MNQPNYFIALQLVVKAFDKLDIDYHVGGSVASSAYGMARTTLDVDVVARLTMPQVPALADMLHNDFYVDAASMVEALRHQSCFNIIHLATMLKVDIFVLKSREYDQTAFQRRKRDILGDDADGVECYLATAEDIILNKLEWYRLGNMISDRQWQDVLGVIRVQRAALDIAYLNTWATQLGLSDLLAKAFSDAAL